MADLHKFTVQEALNASTGNSGGWTVRTETGGSSTIRGTDDSLNEKELNAATTIVIMQGSVEFNFAFSITSNADGDLSTTFDLAVPADTIFSINVPRGLGSTIYLQYQSTTTTEGVLKVIEV